MGADWPLRMSHWLYERKQLLAELIPAQVGLEVPKDLVYI